MVTLSGMLKGDGPCNVCGLCEHGYELCGGHAVRAAIEAMRALDPKYRHAICAEFCKGCGDVNTSCQCWNDD